MESFLEKDIGLSLLLKKLKRCGTFPHDDAIGVRHNSVTQDFKIIIMTMSELTRISVAYSEVQYKINACKLQSLASERLTRRQCIAQLVEKPNVDH